MRGSDSNGTSKREWNKKQKKERKKHRRNEINERNEKKVRNKGER